MAEERRAHRATLAEAAAGGLVVGVRPGGRLEWITPEAPASHPASQPVQAEQGAEVISEQERALVAANRQKIAELRTLPDPSPDLHDIVADIMSRTHPPALSLAAAAWVLQATGLIPIPVFESAAAAVSAVGYLGRLAGHRLHSADLPAASGEHGNPLWQTHPGLATDICLTVMGRVIDGIKNAIRVDDTALEDELDAFYPRWSRTDFEFDLRRYQR